ncbi:hypothetical protein IWW36_004438 [Coemansia brasiliensis]|uniref:R3H domain-containing protein n=1 Tax=Coemansia brasiliensis TaxID=2650707 RepID=A0A9W8LW94_9FUNG|nr:hypothetical protein IWW36_004438 [Coemansia brasiliensis]
MDSADTNNASSEPGWNQQSVVFSQTLERQVDPILFKALSSNAQDRQFVLEAEQLVWQFLGQTRHKRLPLSKQNSYRRLLLHKLGEYYELNHVVVGKQRDEIAFYKKEATTVERVLELPEPLDKRVPLVVTDEEVENEQVEEEPPQTGDSAVSFTHILVKKPRDLGCVKSGRETNAGPHEEEQQQGKQTPMSSQSGKSIEQRQAEYERTRAEIFQQDDTMKLLSNAPIASAESALR